MATTTTQDPENVGNTLDRNVSRASMAAHTTLDKVSTKARPAIDDAVAGAHDAVDKVAERTARAAETVGAKGAQLKAAQQESMEELRSYVRRNPLTALGIAATGSFLLARLLR